MALIDECKKAVRRMRLVTKADVVPYGSFVSTFYNGGSDLGEAEAGARAPGPSIGDGPRSKTHLVRHTSEREVLELTRTLAQTGPHGP